MKKKAKQNLWQFLLQVLSALVAALGGTAMALAVGVML